MNIRPIKFYKDKQVYTDLFLTSYFSASGRAHGSFSRVQALLPKVASVTIEQLHYNGLLPQNSNINTKDNQTTGMSRE